MIRPYQSKDKVQLLQMLKLLIPTYFAEAELDDFENYLEKEREDYFVVEEKGQLIGAGGINYFPKEGTARISWDLMHPDAQGKGIGKALTKHRIKHIKAQSKFHTIVVRTSQLAFGFYEKCGFILDKIEKDFWAKGYDLYQMNMAINKIETSFIKDQYRSGIANYSDFTKQVGLWDSEQYVFQKYLQTNDQILDLGCGTGRTTFPLFLMGYQNLEAIDLTPEMIAEAKKLNAHFGTAINFQVGNACYLNFDNEQFDRVVFSFNGIMSIPNPQNRDKALLEIRRVLKPNGTFIFTTHDRNMEPSFFQFWKEEEERWNVGEQNLQLYEFGDLITPSKNEERLIFIHIPTKSEIENWLNHHGFKVLETFYRTEKFIESDAVKDKSGECRFWVAQKK